MIILYDKTETSFKTLGLGVLNDTISCVVVEQLNGSFELEMEYPLSGQHYKSIELENFIFVKPNMYDNEQAFRIYSISKPFNGIVTINAEHISYDMNGYTIPPFTANNLQEALDIISDTSVVSNEFKFYTDKEVNTKMISPTPSSMRGLIAGREGSLLDIYKGEFIFDMYDVRLVNKRGEDRGVSIKYGKNMLDIEQDITSEKLFTGIFPFYHTTKNETVIERIMIYEEVYTVQGSNPRYSDWLSKYPSDDFLNGGDPLLPIADNTPVQIKTPGDYLDTIFWYQKASHSNNTLVLANITNNPEYSINWLSNFETGASIQPQEYIIYNIRTEGDFEGMKVVWNQSLNKYEDYSGEGFYYIPNIIPPPNFPKEIKSDDNQIEVYKDLRLITDNPNLIDGVLYVEGKKDSPHQKILTLDITDKFEEEPTLEHLLAKAEDYIANNKLDEIKEEIKVSFIKLSDSVEYEHYKDLEKVKLGDTIHISYEKLNIETTKTVIETEYNVLTNTYNEIELGTKKSSLGDTVMIAGSNISELTNDANYTDKIVVGRLLAQYITADLIESKVANFVNAAIESLTVRKMEVTGLIEASAAAINSLVAQSLTAENAEIKEALEAGQVNVKGKITALSGVIGGAVIEDGKLQVPTANITGVLAIGQLPDTIAERSDIPTALSELVNDSGFKNEAEVTTIVDGVITTDYVNALGISVDAANVIGTLVIGQLPNTVAEIEDIPTALSELENDSGFKDESGVTTIVEGKITTDYVEALGITVDAANINGTLAIGQLPDTIAEIEDIPTALSDLVNDSGFKNETEVTTITKGVITTDYVNALGISVDAANVTGTLVIGQLPNTVAEIEDIPTNVSELTNDSGFKNETEVTTITKGVITTDYVNALGISVDAVTSNWELSNRTTSTVAEIEDIPTNVSELTNDSGFKNETEITTITKGVITTDYVEALGISVDAAKVTGTLEIGQLPSTVAETSDIPTALSDLLNDTDFKNETEITTITKGVVTTDYVEALGITVDIANVNDLLNVHGKIDASLIEVDDIVVTNSINIGLQTPWFEHSESNDPERYYYADTVVIDGLTLYRWLSDDEFNNGNQAQFLLTETRNVDIGDVVWGWQSIDDESHGDFSDYEDDNPTQRTIINVGEAQDYNFVVDENGNVTGKGKIDFVMFSVENGIVRAEQFIMGTSGSDASVTINEDGRLTATNAKIIGDIETDHIKSKKVTIQDVINIDLLTDPGTSTSQTVYATVTAVVEQPDEFMLYIYVKVDKDLWYDQTISVRYTYTSGNRYNSTTRTETKSFILRADTTSYPTSGYSDKYDKSKKTYKLFTGIYVLSFDGSITNAYINTRTPSSWKETHGIPGYTSAQIDSHFSPKTDILDLGKNLRRWKRAYVEQPYFTNQPSVSSDRRLKKDVEYDISRYDKLFDGLQPTAYKLVDGESGRTHLGLIAQDLQELLESCDIDSKDFAGFIKQFKDPDILLKKKLEDLTEDDYEYGIRYTELQALQIRQIQLLKDYIQKLEARVAALESNEGS